MATITINGVSIDPMLPQKGLAKMHFENIDASSSDYILIQTKQPLTKAQKQELTTLGVSVLEYVPTDTYLCCYKAKDLEEIRRLNYITWANIYMEGFKIAPSIKFNESDAPRIRNLAETVTKPVKQFSQTPRKVDVVFHKDVDGEKVREKIATAAHVDADDLEVGEGKIRINVQSKYLPAIARIDEVRHIEEVFPIRLHNNVARKIMSAGMNIGGRKFEGEDQIVVVADTGFDMGSVTDVHPAFSGRVIKLYALGRSNKSNDPNGHGTHVAGSVLASGSSDVLGSEISGTAPKAKLIFQSVLDAQGSLGGLPDNLSNLFKDPYHVDGARIHTNSWGSTINAAKYDSNAREVDDFVWKNRDFVICFAAGNEGEDRRSTGKVSEGSVTPPGTAKNCITVGATESIRPNFNLTYGGGWPNDFPVNPIASDKVATNPEGMAAFSSRGPTQDHRIKPDVVAPGTFILSALSRAVTSTNPGWAKSDDPLYVYEGGTSMATPLVAGCVAVVREYLTKEKKLSKPSAALIKAMLINGAKNIAGQYTPSESGNIPNNSEGFGRVNLETTIGPFAEGSLLQLIDENKELDTNDEETVKIVVPATAKALKVTLVWSDPPGEVLQNDLDLIVRSDNGKERHGNVSVQSSNFDRENNVEQVFWDTIAPGNYEIIVKAFRITRWNQSYALVIRTE